MYGEGAKATRIAAPRCGLFVPQGSFLAYTLIFSGTHKTHIFPCLVGRLPDLRQ